MSPQYAMGTTFEFHEPDVLDQLRLPSGCNVCRQAAVGVAMENERRYGVASNVLTEVLNPCIDASLRADRRRAGGNVRVPRSRGRTSAVNLL